MIGTTCCTAFLILPFQSLALRSFEYQSSIGQRQSAPQGTLRSKVEPLAREFAIEPALRAKSMRLDQLCIFKGLKHALPFAEHPEHMHAMRFGELTRLTSSKEQLTLDGREGSYKLQGQHIWLFYVPIKLGLGAVFVHPFSNATSRRPTPYRFRALRHSRYHRFKG